jgi:hypothetical protein
MRILSLHAPGLLPRYNEVHLNFGSLNLFLGPNNAGKTKLLELLHTFLCRAYQRTDHASEGGNPDIFRFSGRLPSFDIEIQPGDTQVPNPPSTQGVGIETQCFLPSSSTRFKCLTSIRAYGSNFDTRNTEEMRRRSDQDRGAGTMLAELAGVGSWLQLSRTR